MKVAEVIPYKDFKDRMRKTEAEIRKGKYVEVWQDLKVIYSANKRKRKRGGRNE